MIQQRRVLIESQPFQIVYHLLVNLIMLLGMSKRQVTNMLFKICSFLRNQIVDYFIVCVRVCRCVLKEYLSMFVVFTTLSVFSLNCLDFFEKTTLHFEYSELSVCRDNIFQLLLLFYCFSTTIEMSPDFYIEI